MTKADIDSYKPEQINKKIEDILKYSPLGDGGVATDKEGFTDIPNSQVRGVIARRLAESKFSAPHFYLTMEINMDNAIATRTQLNEIAR